MNTDNVMRAVEARDARLLDDIGNRERAWEHFLEETDPDENDPEMDAKFEEWLEEQKELAAEYMIAADDFWTGW